MKSEELPGLRPSGVGSKAGAEAPGLGRFKEIGFLREGGNRNQVPQKRCFCGSPIIKNAPGEMNSPCAKVLACGQNACDGALAPGPRSGLLLHSSLLLLTSAKRARGPGPGRPRGWQVCRKPAPGPAGPDKRAPAAASASPPLFLLTPPYRRLIINIEKGRCDKRLALSVN